MADNLIFVSRITRLALIDLDDTPLGRIEDVILLPHHDDEAPWVVGFVARVQRRRIFVNANRIASLDAHGVQLRSASVNLRRFEQRPGEILTSGLLSGRRVGDLLLRDIGLRRVSGVYPGWEVAELIVGGGGPIPLRRRPVRTLSWTLAPDLFDIGQTAREAAALTDLHPSEGAKRLRALPKHRRQELVRAMEEEDLAHLLEELPEPEQVQLLAALDLAQAVGVLEAMAPDDAADLLAELPSDERTELLEAMDEDEAESLQRLLAHGQHTAGGLMNPEPVIVVAGAPVAEALAKLRDRDLAAPLATQVFVVEPPIETPTGRFLGFVGFQRLLREPPSLTVGQCLEDDDDAISVAPEMPETAVAERLAEYNLLAVPVCDDRGRLLGAVTVDDVLDRTLPVGWRSRRR